MSIQTARCWVLRARNDEVPDIGTEFFDAHYGDPIRAFKGRAELIEGHGIQALTGVHVSLLPHRCVFLTCDRCGANLEDLDSGFGLHFLLRRELIREAIEQVWVTDGELWRCDVCHAGHPSVGFVVPVPVEVGA
ncbi:hypothetical protein GCM10022223_46980 [Kineosporia mesophila]|uniref:Uncharacterized protein n=1 Tax=Kineosporia mesophila TaxID=566012 RepID=A0ABP7A443_9ACTN|nr:hypothetical protein [Kineosporia mesophila]MCD5353806.1 hypothetical protein [Kineosporia mesophila]